MRASPSAALPALPALILLAALPACGPSRFDGTVYRDDETTYSVGVPDEGWRLVSIDADNDLSWHHDGLAAVVQVNASCDPGLDIPLVALTNHLLVGFTQREVVEQELVSLDRREALRTVVNARLDGVPRTLLLTVIKKDGCVYDFALVAPPGRFERARQAYDALLGGFHAEARDP